MNHAIDSLIAFGKAYDTIQEYEQNMGDLEVRNQILVTIVSMDRVALDRLRQSVNGFQAVMNCIIGARKETSAKGRNNVEESVLGDLQGVARDTYSGATILFKSKAYDTASQLLECAFGLTESYLDHVMCSHQAAANTAVNEVHDKLKADSIASLWAYCLRERNELSRSRKAFGCAIMYGANIKALVGYIDKYVGTAMDEINSGMESAKGIPSDVSSLLQQTSIAWKTRLPQNGQQEFLTRLFIASIEQASIRVMSGLRTQETYSPKESDHKPLEIIEIFGEIQLQLWALRLGQDSAYIPMCEALVNRSLAFSQFYLVRDTKTAIAKLSQAYGRLSDAIHGLNDSDKGRSSIESAGACAWRGIIGLEILQLAAYKTDRELELNDGKDTTVVSSIDESKCMEDIQHCVFLWSRPQVDFNSASVFDLQRSIDCLDVACNALSLLSCVQLETDARELLQTLQARRRQSEEAADQDMIGPPLVLLEPSLLPIPVRPNVKATASASVTEAEDEQSRDLFEMVDAETGLCVSFILEGDVANARTHHTRAADMMSTIRSNYKLSSQAPQRYKVAAMREILLQLLSSDIAFREGSLRRAIDDAKNALSVCWKLSKLVGVVDSSQLKRESEASEKSDSWHGGHFKLPEEVRRVIKHGALSSSSGSSLIYFQALECWSWDVLHATKLTLCRIAWLHLLTHQLHRSSVYYTEAMALVGGLPTVGNRQQPLLEFTQLQILAERTTHATALHRLITSESAQEQNLAAASTLVLQRRCEELIQAGDISMLEEKFDMAAESYREARFLIVDFVKSASMTQGLQSVLVGCDRRTAMLYRRRINELSDDTVDEFFSTLKRLKRSAKLCQDVLELAESMCELADSSIALLRSTSISRGFLSPEKIIAVMEDAFQRADHLGVSHLSRRIRHSLGCAYLTAEDQASKSDTSDRSCGRSAVILSNSNAIDYPPSASDEVSALNVGAYADSECAEIQTSVSGFEVFDIVQATLNRVQRLPSSWRVVSLMVGPSDDLILSVIEPHGDVCSFWVGCQTWKESVDDIHEIIDASRLVFRNQVVFPQG
ncbi:hypothetical protein PINS_up008700 [Pythium insidiosum]|nr:hypothetical protein PINS_up008700 [Pythium insidiosum]